MIDEQNIMGKSQNVPNGGFAPVTAIQDVGFALGSREAPTNIRYEMSQSL